MTRVRIFACAGASLALAVVAWLLPEAADAPAAVSAGVLSRSAGVALLGLAMIATGLAFRAATRTEQKPALATLRPRVSEYRRGFGARAIQAKAQPRQSMQRGVVVSLRRAVATQAGMPPIEAGTVLPPAEIARLQRMLQDRRGQLEAREAAVAAKRSLTRDDADLNDPAPR